MIGLGKDSKKRIPEFVKERDPTLLGDKIGSMGNKLTGITYY